MKAKIEINKLSKAESKYYSVVSSLERKIYDLVEFEFTIFCQAGDGFVMEHNAYNATLEPLLGLIEKNGKLTLDDYFKHTI